MGRDVLGKFNLGLKALSPEEAIITQEIFNIVLEPDNVTNPLQINPEIDQKIQDSLKKLFISDYVEPERPESPKIKMQLNLRLTNDHIIYFGPRKLSFAEKTQLQIILDSLKLRKIIRDSDSPYASPIVLVRKKNGEYRLCIDYRFLNKITLRDNYPLPLIEDQIDRLRDKNFLHY